MSFPGWVWKNEWLKKPKNSFSKTQQQRKTATHQNQRQYVKKPEVCVQKSPLCYMWTCEHWAISNVFKKQLIWPNVGCFHVKEEKKVRMIIALLKKKIVICVKNLQHKPKRYDVKTEKSILFMDFLLFQQPRSIYLFLVWMFIDFCPTVIKEIIRFAFKRRFKIPPRF